MMHVLVTGAGGYIGSVLVPQLLEAGHRVTALDRFFFGEETLAPVIGDNRLTLLRRDVRDVRPEDLAGIDAICDLAALSNDPAGDLDPDLTESVNFRARKRLGELAQAVGIDRYVLASSCSVYGFSNGEVVDETAVPKPLTTYARCNVLAEEALFGLKGDAPAVTVLRNATVFGLSPRMRFDLVVNIMTLHAVQRGRILVMGGGRQWRPLVHVGDVARTILAVLAAPMETVRGKIYNVGNFNTQIRTLAYTAREVLPFKLDIEIASDDADKRDYRVSFKRLAEVIDPDSFRAPDYGFREIYQALKSGAVEDTPMTQTVGWYRQILAAKALIDRITLEGRLL